MLTTTEFIHALIEKYPDDCGFEFSGKCLDCGSEVNVAIDVSESEFKISGGALYHSEKDRLKCDSCFQKKPRITQECTVYSRVVGYLSPVKYWNNGKQAEFRKRRMVRL